MKHLKLFFVLFAMLALGVGNAWGAEYELVTSEPSDWSGEYLVVYNKGCFNGSLTTGFDKSAPVAVTISNNKINLDEKYAMIIGKQGTAYSLKTASGYYIGRESSSSNGMDASQTWSTKYTINFTWDATKKTVKIAGKGGKCLGLNSTTWRFYASSNAYVNLSLYKKVETSATQPTLSSIEISGDLTKKTYEEGDELDLAGLTVNAIYDDASTKVVTNDVEWSYTPNPLTQGTTSVDITATYTENSVEKTVTKTITDLTVNEHIITPGEKCTGTLGYAFWGLTAEKLTATANEINYTKEFDDVTVNIKNGSKANAYFKSDHTRVYSGGYTMTFSVPNGYIITNIAFTASGSYWEGNHTANVGTMSDNKNWTGANQNVTITFNGSCRIESICVTYKADVKYALTITEPTEGGTLVVKDGENTLTSGVEIYEGTKLTVTATPETGYEDGVVVVKNASDEDITATVYADGVLTMPAYAVTISATFEEKPCELLAKPTVSAETTYNSATLTWEAVTNAAKYSVKVGTADAVETTETSYDVTGLNAETEYTYQVQAIAEADQDTYCDSEVAEDTFTTATAPTATLTLKDIVGTTTLTGSLNGTITLPTEAAECSKTFVGWDADEDCDHAPTYAKGTEYTLAAETQTLYAVYADGEGGEPTWNRVTNLAALTSGGTFILGYEATAKSGKIIPMRTSGTATTSTAGYMYSGNADGTTSNNATLDMASISESSKFEIVLEASSIVDGAVNIKLGDNYLGNTDTKNNCKLFTSASKNTAFTPTIGTNDVVKLTIKANNDYTTLQFNNNSGSYRYAVYGGAQKDVVFYKKEITLSYSNYSTTCAAAPIVTVTPETVSVNAISAEGKVTVTYENVNTENVAVALFNDEACTEAFTADWLTASLDGDKNITYTVAENTTYAERKAYIKLTAPETTGATDPDVVVIPVTQAAKDKVFASLEELVAADLTAGDEVTVTLNNDVIKEFYIYSSKRCGVVFDVQKDGEDIKIYFNSQTTIDNWAEGGKLSGTLTNVKWTTYNSAWQLAPANTWAWANLTYTEPKAVSTVVVSGAPTKTTYVDGEAFDPAGLTVTVNYNDATSEVNPTGVTFTVTPTTLVKGQTSVSVTATYNSVTSAAYEVTGLTVNDIPTKTVDEFIAAGGIRCYLEGIVSNITNTTYGNFDLTDASCKIYVYGCLNAAGEKQKFAELGVKNGDKIKVIADQFKVYSGKNQATDVQYVSHISAASITVENITMEVDEVATISATVDPVDAVVTYTIKENAANAISLSGNTITALEEGTATITATVAEGATYLGNSVDFTVTVGPKTESDEVVILAEHNGQWYALKAEDLNSDKKVLAALAVTYFNGTLYNVNESDKISITWTRTVVGDQVTFKNGTNYLYVANPSKTELSLNATAFSWTYDAVLDTYTSNNGARTFLYSSEANGFKNFAINNNVGTKNYSGYPVVTAPIYTTGDVTYTRATTAGKFGTICLPFGSTNYTGAEFFEFVGSETGKVYIGSVDELVAGVPYIFLASAAKVVVTSDGTTAATPGNSNGLYGTFTDNTEVAVGNYILKDNAICEVAATCWVNAYRAYIVMSDVPEGASQQMPGRRYIGMSVQGENEATGFENITAPAGKTVKAIVNGQLIIIRDGEMYNAQGQRL